MNKDCKNKYCPLILQPEIALKLLMPQARDKAQFCSEIENNKNSVVKSRNYARQYTTMTTFTKQKRLSDPK